MSILICEGQFEPDLTLDMHGVQPISGKHQNSPSIKLS